MNDIVDRLRDLNDAEYKNIGLQMAAAETIDCLRREVAALQGENAALKEDLSDMLAASVADMPPDLQSEIAKNMKLLFANAALKVEVAAMQGVVKVAEDFRATGKAWTIGIGIASQYAERFDVALAALAEVRRT